MTVFVCIHPLDRSANDASSLHPKALRRLNANDFLMLVRSLSHMCMHFTHHNVCAADVIVLDMSDDDDFALKSTDDVPEDSLHQLGKNAGKSLEQPKDKSGGEREHEAEVGNEGGEVITKQSLSEEPQSDDRCRY